MKGLFQMCFIICLEAKISMQGPKSPKIHKSRLRIRFLFKFPRVCRGTCQCIIQFYQRNLQNILLPIHLLRLTFPSIEEMFDSLYYIAFFLVSYQSSREELRLGSAITCRSILLVYNFALFASKANKLRANCKTMIGAHVALELAG